MSRSAVPLSSDAPRSLAGCFPPCDFDLSEASLPPSTAVATHSLYVTFKVLQLVNTLRTRVKTRVQRVQRHPIRNTNFCQGFERLAYEEIDKYLGRKAVHSPRTQAKTSVRTACITKTLQSNTTKCLLDKIDQAVEAETYPLTLVASRDDLFLQRKAELALIAEHISTQDLTELLVVVADLLQRFGRLPSLRGSDSTICEGHQLPNLDLSETCSLNLEHLLLCLKDQLLRLLIARLVEVIHKHIADCQREQGQHSANWFFEYPNAQHPLSTTWPWSIRPSLAVLWGVCWMFYDRDDNNKKDNSNSPPSRRPNVNFDSHLNMLDEQGQVIAPSHLVFEYLSALQQQHHGLHPANRRQGNMPRQPRETGLPPRAHAIPHSRASPIMAAPQYRGLTPIAQSPSRPHRPNVTAGVAHAAASAGLAPPGANNTYTAAPPAYDAPPAAPNSSIWLPEDTFGSDYQPNPASAYQPADVNAWQPVPAHSLTDQQQQQHQHQAPAFADPWTLPPRSRNSLTPTISVDTRFNYSGLPPQQPQDTNYQSATPVTSASSLHPPDPFNYSGNFHHNNQLSPPGQRFMNPDQEMQRTPPRSPHAPVVGVGESLSRKRSHSDMSAGGAVAPLLQNGGSRSGSVASIPGAHSPAGEYSPGSRAFKRDDPPPMNADHKYICTFAPECVALIFDRKCEWSKHMDKHDRPYRCSHASCAKLQGFTYSGGLLRHEREVHGKHGGPKSQLMCPYKDCKRHNGKGFTRKENLNEHVRRVHLNKDDQSQGMALKRDATDAFPGADELETPDADAFDPEDQLSPMRKRRRQFSEIGELVASDEVEELKREIMYLRDENHAKESRIMAMELKLEEEKQSWAEEMGKLQASMGQMQQQLQQQQQAQVQS